MVFTVSRKSGLTLIALLVPLALGLSACNSPDKRGEQRQPPPQVHAALSGSAQFFQNRIQAVTNLDSVPQNAQGPRKKRETNAHASGKGQGRGSGQREGQSGRLGRNNHGSQQPPLALRVTFTNLSSSPIDFSIREINSALGNFVAQPDQATLAPGEQIELEPMISRMGVISGSIHLELELRAEGETESQTITLKENPIEQ
jgi:hypothetical protein